MANISKISDKATKINYSNNVLYYFAFGTIIVHGDNMQIKFFNGVEQHFVFSEFATVEPDFESYIDSLIALDYFRVPTTGSAGGGGGGGDASAANQTTQISLATTLNGLVSTAANQVLTNTKLDTLIANNATASNQVAANTKLDSIISALSGVSTEAKQDDIITAINNISLDSGTEGYDRNTTLDRILQELKTQTKLLKKILN